MPQYLALEEKLTNRDHSLRLSLSTLPKHFTITFSYFLTGVDQHGQKVQQTAEREDVHPATYVRKTTKNFTNAWKSLELEYDGWAETMDDNHKACVADILQKLYDQGQIYKKQYKGFYSIKQESRNAMRRTTTSNLVIT